MEWLVSLGGAKYDHLNLLSAWWDMLWSRIGVDIDTAVWEQPIHEPWKDVSPSQESLLSNGDKI